MNKKILSILVTPTLLCGFASLASAVSGRFSDWLNYYNGTYPAGKFSSSSCNVCHTSAPAFNSYGSALMGKGMTKNSLASAMMVAVESSDSDGDGFTNIAEIRAGTLPGVGSSTPPAACTGYTYSGWSACGTNGQQTRTVTGNTPANCTGTPPTQPVLTQACTPPTGDTTAPTIISFNIQAVSNTPKIAITDFTAADNAGVTGYMVKKTSTPPTAQDAGWQAAPPTSIKFGGQGVKTVYA